jgi:molybdopterin-binding protein
LAALIGSNPDKRAKISAGNRLDGVILGVDRDGVMAKIEIACGPYRLVSLMSVEAADDLGLEPGVDASALLESINVMVEIGQATGEVVEVALRPTAPVLETLGTVASLNKP